MDLDQTDKAPVTNFTATRIQEHTDSAADYVRTSRPEVVAETDSISDRPSVTLDAAVSPQAKIESPQLQSSKHERNGPVRNIAAWAFSCVKSWVRSFSIPSEEPVRSKSAPDTCHATKNRLSAASVEKRPNRRVVIKRKSAAYSTGGMEVYSIPTPISQVSQQSSKQMARKANQYVRRMETNLRERQDLN